MRLRTLLPTTLLCIFGMLSLTATKLYADTITPSIYKQSFTLGTTTTGNVTFKNEDSVPVTITPTASAYDPKTLQLITGEKSIFVILDKETYIVQPQKSLTLSYEIKPPVNLEPGTYFNLIILQKNLSTGYINQDNQIGAAQSLSQLVAINIFEGNDTTQLQISGDFAQISMEVIDSGIPFLRPLKIKYIYQNTTNYVLEPQGEIQIFDSKSSYAPIYQHINATNKKLYPGDTLEETFSITNWKISDILFGRKIVGRFYNGIDQNSITKELSQNSYYSYLAILLAIVFLIIILIKSIQSDKRKDSK